MNVIVHCAMRVIQENVCNTSNTKVRCFRQRSSPSLPSRVTFRCLETWIAGAVFFWSKTQNLTQLFVFFQTRNWRESASEASSKQLLNPVCLPSNLSKALVAKKNQTIFSTNLSTANGAQMPLSWRVKQAWKMFPKNVLFMEKKSLTQYGDRGQYLGWI